MKRKKTRLRLRKQVILAIPIALILSIGMVLFVTKNNMAYSSNVEVEQTNSENEISNSLSESALISSLKQNIDDIKRDNTISFYAERYKLNTSKAILIARKLTNNYKDVNFLKNNSINPKGNNGSYKSFEAGVIVFIKTLYTYPERYGTTANEIRLSNEIDTEKKIVSGKVYMKNGYTFEQYLGKICDLYDIDKNVALSIVYLETGSLKSNLFKNSNNVGGQRGYSGWLKFPTLEAGVISFVLNLRSIINNHNIDMKSENAILDLSSIYVSGHEGSPSESWTGKINTFVSKIKEKDLFKV